MSPSRYVDTVAVSAPEILKENKLVVLSYSPWATKLTRVPIRETLLLTPTDDQDVARWDLCTTMELLTVHRNSLHIFFGAMTHSR